MGKNRGEYSHEKYILTSTFSPFSLQLFLACLCNLQNESLLNEVDTDKLFSNIQEIYFANLNFWREHVTRMLDASRSSRQPLDPTLLTDAFYKVSAETHNGLYSGTLTFRNALPSRHDHFQRPPR